MQDKPMKFKLAVLNAWIKRSNPHVIAHRCYPFEYDTLEPNPQYHPGKATLIYKRFAHIIDHFIN